MKQQTHLSCDHATRFIIKGKTLRVMKLVDHKTMQKKGLYEFKWATVATYKRVSKAKQ